MRPGPILTGVLAAVLCGSAAAQTTVLLPAHLAEVGPAQREAGERWMATRGIDYKIAYDSDGRIVFSFGGTTHHLTETEFLTAVHRVLGGATIAVVERVSLDNDHDARLTEVTYFEKRGERNGFLYSWPAGNPQVLKLNYSLRQPTSAERSRGFVGGLFCVDQGRGTPELCSSAYDMLIGYHGWHVGDPFDLRDQVVPANVTLTSAWPDATPLIPERAPQDAALLGYPE